jgi:hypothetical protein
MHTDRAPAACIERAPRHLLMTRASDLFGAAARRNILWAAVETAAQRQHSVCDVSIAGVGLP